MYKFGQKHLGQLNANPISRFNKQVEMVRWLARDGASVAGKSFFEVGTGHLPVVPIGFYLSGAKETWTVDLNRRVDWALVSEMLRWMGANMSAVAALYRNTLVSAELFEERFAALVKSTGNPRARLERAGIRYLAPVDAAATLLAAESVDCHYSVTVLEHIPLESLRGLLAEAGRILRRSGHALHFVDLSDHFQHQDKSISRINCLQYSDAEWRRLAGNRFAYNNRLRSSDHLRIMSEAGFHVVHLEKVVDEQARALMREGFRVDSRFSAYDEIDLCTTSLRVLLRK